MRSVPAHRRPQIRRSRRGRRRGRPRCSSIETVPAWAAILWRLARRGDGGEHRRGRPARRPGRDRAIHGRAREELELGGLGPGPATCPLDVRWRASGSRTTSQQPARLRSWGGDLPRRRGRDHDLSGCAPSTATRRLPRPGRVPPAEGRRRPRRGMIQVSADRERTATFKGMVSRARPRPSAAWRAATRGGTERDDAASPAGRRIAPPGRVLVAEARRIALDSRAPCEVRLRRARHVGSVADARRAGAERPDARCSSSAGRPRGTAGRGARAAGRGRSRWDRPRRGGHEGPRWPGRRGDEPYGRGELADPRRLLARPGPGTTARGLIDRDGPATGAPRPSLRARWPSDAVPVPPRVPRRRQAGPGARRCRPDRRRKTGLAFSFGKAWSRPPGRLLILAVFTRSPPSRRRTSGRAGRPAPGRGRGSAGRPAGRAQLVPGPGRAEGRPPGPSAPRAPILLLRRPRTCKEGAARAVRAAMTAPLAQAGTSVFCTGS